MDKDKTPLHIDAEGGQDTPELRQKINWPIFRYI